VGLFKINKMVSYNCVLDVQFDDGEIVEPVTLSEAKDFCKIDISTDDAILTELITAAREMCEDFTNIGFVEHSIIAIVNNSNGDIELPYGPTIEVIQVKNADGDVLELDDDYTLSGNLFKSLKTPKEDGIEITYLSGYQVLPKRLKTAVLNTIYYLWDNRAMSVDRIYDKNVPSIGNIGPISEMILKPLSRVI
jgi:uncharacterized phiE125 gp8 family phage protein